MNPEQMFRMKYARGHFSRNKWRPGGLCLILDFFLLQFAFETHISQ